VKADHTSPMEFEGKRDDLDIRNIDVFVRKFINLLEMTLQYLLLILLYFKIKSFKL
jgi:hypothetical protein